MKKKSTFVFLSIALSFIFSPSVSIADDSPKILDEKLNECQIVLGVTTATHSASGEHKMWRSNSTTPWKGSHAHVVAGIFDKIGLRYRAVQTSSAGHLNPSFGKRNPPSFSVEGRNISGFTPNGWLSVPQGAYTAIADKCSYSPKQILKSENAEFNSNQLVGLSIPPQGCYCLKWTRRFDVLAERLYGDRITQVQSLLLSELDLLKTQNEITEEDYQLIKARLIDDLKTHFVEQPDG